MTRKEAREYGPDVEELFDDFQDAFTVAIGLLELKGNLTRSKVTTRDPCEILHVFDRLRDKHMTVFRELRKDESEHEN